MIKKKIKVKTKYGEGIIDKIGITELGYGRVTVYYPDQGVWKSFIIQDMIEKILADQEVELLDEAAV